MLVVALGVLSIVPTLQSACYIVVFSPAHVFWLRVQAFRLLAPWISLDVCGATLSGLSRNPPCLCRAILGI
jgi:hypothetical protein